MLTGCLACLGAVGEQECFGVVGEQECLGAVGEQECFGVVGEQECWCSSLPHIEVIERRVVALADLVVWLSALEEQVFCFAVSHVEQQLSSLC